MTAPVFALQDVERAREALKGVIHRTPLTPSATFSDMTGADVAIKMENLQRTGSFKIRGAFNRIASIPEDERARGVVCASAGNHAQGVAYAARVLGIPATIVMPIGAPLSKVLAVRGYGAEQISFGKDYNEAEAKAFEIAKARGGTFVHAFNDPLVAAGQGTLGLEILEEMPDVETVVVPVGGGGLIAGVATAVKAVRPGVRVVGVEPAGAAKLPEALKKGRVVPLSAVGTIADGLATRAVGEVVFPVIRDKVDEVASVDDQDIAAAILLLLERAKTVVEGAGAAGLAALLARKFSVRPREKVVVLLSGGNIDVTLLDTIIQRGLAQTGRTVEFSTVLNDKPGALRDLLGTLADLQANVEVIDHDRSKLDVGIGKALVRVKVDTRGPDHVREIVDSLEKRGYPVRLG